MVLYLLIPVTVALLLGFRLRTTDLGVQFGMRGNDGITGWRRRARPWVYAAAAVAVTAAGAWAFVVAYWIVAVVLIGLLADKVLFSPWEKFLHRRWGTGK